MKKCLYLIVCFISSILLISCAGGGRLNYQQKPVAAIGGQHALVLSVTSACEVPQEVIDQLYSKISSDLSTLNQVASVSKTNGDLKLVVQVTQFKPVNTTDRIFLGAMAGRARLKAKLSLYDPNTDKLRAEANAESESSGGCVFAGTSPQAIEELAKQVAQFAKQSI